MIITAGLILSCFAYTSRADSPYSLSGAAYIRKTGYSIGSNKSGILTLGRRASGKGLQAINISLGNLNPGLTGSLQYRIYIPRKGWQPWTDNGQTAGFNTIPGLITAVQMCLTGKIADEYSIWYAAWTDRHKDVEGWVSDGAVAASPTENRRIEELRVMLVKKDTEFGYTDISFRSHMQKFGWEKKWQYSGHVTGRAGKHKRLEGFEISLRGNEYNGGIRYRALIGGRNWTSWVNDGAYCGTLKRNKKIEALEIQLTGDIANHYDLYYRTYSGGLGWFNWAKNGEASGSRRIGRHIEALQIVLVRKGAKTPEAVAKIKTTIGYKYVAATSNVGVSEWRITANGNSNNFGAAVIRRAKHYNRTEYKDMRCDALVAQVLIDVLGTNLGKVKGRKYARLNEWIGLSALESLLSSTFTYRDSAGRLVICRPVAQTKLKKLVKKTWKRREKKITEDDFNTWLKNNCKPGDIIIFYNKDKKPIHCGIYSGIQTGSAKEFEYFRGSNKGKKDSDTKPGPYMWHSGNVTGVANKYAFWVAEVGRSYYVKRFRVDSGKSQPLAPKQTYP